MEKIIGLYLILINGIGFCIMGWDKHQAKVHGRRIAEKNLFFISIIGGSIGSWLGMYYFHHKTKHWYFVLGMPLILLIQIGIVYSWFFLF